MVQWKENELAIIQQFKGMKIDQIFSALPESLRRYKCHTCHFFFDEQFLYGANKQCPKCGEAFENLRPLCVLDHNHCNHDITSGIEYCPICKDPICPECGTHDVVQISRVTGYYANVSGFNEGKKQELKDRTRYNINSAGIIPSPIALTVKV